MILRRLPYVLPDAFIFGFLLWSVYSYYDDPYLTGLLCFPVYLFALLLTVYTLFNYVRKRSSLPKAFKIIHVGIMVTLLVLVIVFRGQLMLVKDVAYFNTHRDGFLALPEAARNSTCYVSGSECFEGIRLPTDIQAAVGRESISVSADDTGTGYIVVSGRGTLGTAFVYCEAGTILLNTRLGLRGGIFYCSQPLGEGWYMCEEST